MAWPTPKFSKSQVNRAGQFLIDPKPDVKKIVWAVRVVGNWRSCHGYPINTFQATLRDKLKTIDPNALVAQRLKRFPSIINKLIRFKSMHLARMQDIGGLRAVVSNLKQAQELEENYRKSRFAHELISYKDYISNPKESGYRSIHLAYRYRNNRAPEYDGLCVELQIRTRLQHAWATAVETMGTFLSHSLKSSEGPKEWLDFFALAGASFAHLEGTPPVPGFEDMSKEKINLAVVKQAAEMDIENRLTGFSFAAAQIHTVNRRGMYHLIVLNFPETSLTISSFSQRQLDEANKSYVDIERRIQKGEELQVVLVSAGSLDNLRRAYPNYFLDTQEFIKYLDRVKKQAEKL